MTTPASGLCEQTLGGRARRVAVPPYDRSALVRSVVQVGVGPRRTRMGEVLQAQDGLLTVVARGGTA